MRTTAFPRDHGIWVSRRVVAIILPLYACAVLWLMLATPDERHVLLPIMAVGITAVSFWVSLWNRDGTLPVFEIGTVCMAASVAYSVIPLVGYLFAGLQFSHLSDIRLAFHSPTPQELGVLAWRYVVYVVSFAVIYLLVRGKCSLRTQRLHVPDARTIGVFIALALLFSGLLGVVQFIYGFDLWSAYDSSLYESYEKFQQLPLLLRQSVPKAQGGLLVVKLGLLAMLMASWNVKRWRYLVIVWLSVNTISFLVKMGSRTELLMIFLACGLLYHRLVRPLKPTFVVWASLLLLVGTIVFGVMRGGADLTINVANLISMISSHAARELFSIANEFQTLFAGTFDLYQLKQAGTLSSVPWQVYAAEILMLLPQQILPFEKVSVQSWYSEVSEVPSYFMYGPISQAILGLDWIELVARGALLGCIFAKVHRWYVRRASGFHATLFYLWLTLWSYYTIRNSTFYFVAFIVFDYIPVVVLVAALRMLVAIRSSGAHLKLNAREGMV